MSSMVIPSLAFLFISLAALPTSGEWKFKLALSPNPNVDKYFAKEVQATSHFKDIFCSHLSGDWTTKD